MGDERDWNSEMRRLRLVFARLGVCEGDDDVATRQGRKEGAGIGDLREAKGLDWGKLRRVGRGLGFRSLAVR